MLLTIRLILRPNFETFCTSANFSKQNTFHLQYESYSVSIALNNKIFRFFQQLSPNMFKPQLCKQVSTLARESRLKNWVAKNQHERQQSCRSCETDGDE